MTSNRGITFALVWHSIVCYFENSYYLQRALCCMLNSRCAIKYLFYYFWKTSTIFIGIGNSLYFSSFILDLKKLKLYLITKLHNDYYCFDFVNWDCTSCTSCTTLHTFSLRFCCLMCRSYRIYVVGLIIGTQLCWSWDFLTDCVFRGYNCDLKNKIWW